MKVGQRIRYKGQPARVVRLTTCGTWIKRFHDPAPIRAAADDLAELPPSPRQVRRDDMILAAIDDVPLDAYAIAEKVHATRRYVLSCIDRMHTSKRVFIRKWHTRPGAATPTPMWQAGDDPDAQRPCALSTQEQNRIGHARRKAKRDNLALPRGIRGSEPR